MYIKLVINSYLTGMLSSIECGLDGMQIMAGSILADSFAGWRAVPVTVASWRQQQPCTGPMALLCFSS